MIDRVISYLRNVKKSGDGYVASCPAHDDNRPSLSLTEKDGKLLFRCHAGCAQAEVWRALKELGALGNPEGKNCKIVEEYPYQNPDGTVSFIVCRFYPKDFRAKQPDGSWGMKGKEKIPYRLPNVIKARNIFIVEGEKDVHTIERLGYVGTTFPFGAAKKWKPEYSEYFRGKRVAVIPDNDEPGIEYARNICNGLAGCAELVKFVWLPGVPEKGDVSDWVLDNEDAAEKLVGLVKAAPRWDGRVPLRPDDGLFRMVDVKPRKVEFLWHPYIPIGKITLIDGDPGVGKSWLTQAIATGLSLGYGIPDLYAEPCNTLMLSTEDDPEDTIRPRLESMGAQLSRIFVASSYFELDDIGLEKLELLIQQTNAKAVFIDPLVAYFGSQLDMNKANETRALMAKLASIAESYRCALVGIRHLRKEAKSAGKAIYRGTGSIDIVGAARSALIVVEDTDLPHVRKIHHIKSNVAQRGKTIAYQVDRGEFFWIWPDGGMKTASGDYPEDEEMFA